MPFFVSPTLNIIRLTGGINGKPGGTALIGGTAAGNGGTVGNDENPE